MRLAPTTRKVLSHDGSRATVACACGAISVVAKAELSRLRSHCRHCPRKSVPAEALETLERVLELLNNRTLTVRGIARAYKERYGRRETEVDSVPEVQTASEGGDPHVVDGNHHTLPRTT